MLRQGERWRAALGEEWRALMWYPGDYRGIFGYRAGDLRSTAYATSISLDPKPDIDVPVHVVGTP